MGTVTAMEIANALGQSKRTINLRAKKEGWKFTSVKARGGKIPHYDVSSLPHDVRSALADMSDPVNVSSKAISVVAYEKHNEEQHKEIVAKRRQQAVATFAGIHGASKERAESALYILTLANQSASQSDSKTCGWNSFIQAYNSKELDIDAKHYNTKPSISYSTLARWEKQYQKDGINGLLPKFGKNKGCGVIDKTPGMRDYCVALIHEYPHIKGARLAELLGMEFGEEYTLPSEPTCRRWLQIWKEENRTTFLSLVDPSGWQNKHMAAFGSRSASIARINQLWEFDSTPADVMLTDGRYSIVGVIDVFTRRVKVVLKPTSNSEAIALLLRNAILDWGVPEVARTDNGSDYLSAHIRSVWDALDIHNDITNPYSGWEKPFIERFFRTFSHDFAELLQGYIGHNVAERERISARLTFAQRLIERREKGKDRVALDVNLSAEQFESFLNNWIESHYHHRRHDKLGCSPFEKFNAHRQAIRTISDERMLDVLLAPVPSQNGFRTVLKEGLSIEGMTYIHAELGAYIGDRVFCRYNPDDVGKVYVFHALHNHFICEAVNPEIAGNDITMAHAQEAKRLQRNRLREQRDSIKRAAKKHDVSDAAHKYLEFRQSQTGALSSFPKPHEAVSTTAIDSAKQVAASAEKSGFSEQQKSDFERRRKELEAIEHASAEPTFRDDHHKARFYTEQNQKGALDPLEKNWLHQYRAKNPRAAAMLDSLYQSQNQRNTK